MSETDVRETPLWLFSDLNAEFNFDLDAAANAENTLCPKWLGPGSPIGEDALAVEWHDHGSRVWCNPPYSRGSIPKWCEKMEYEASHGITVVALLPADTSTRYFHTFVLPNEHRFIKGRLAFQGAPRDRNGRLAPAKFGSVIVVFRKASPKWTYGGRG